MKFLHGKSYRKEVESFFSNDDDLDIAVAFFGSDSLGLFDSSKNKKVRVVCNLESGACNPFLIEKIITRKNITAKTNSKLHAKTLVQKESTIIGSANISSNGLSLEGNEVSSWIETGISTKSPEVVCDSKSWFRKTWDTSIEITASDLESYKKLWEEKRNSRISNNTNLSILEAAKDNIATFQDRKIYFAVYRDQNPSPEALEALEAAKSIHSNLSSHIDFFEDWSDLPENAHLISIYVGPKYGVNVDGIFKTHHKKLTEKFTNDSGETSEITLCFKERDILGHKLTENDKTIIRKNISSIMACKETEEHEAFLVPLSAGVAKLQHAFNRVAGGL